METRRNDIYEILMRVRSNCMTTTEGIDSINELFETKCDDISIEIHFRYRDQVLGFLKKYNFEHEVLNNNATLIRFKKVNYNLLHLIINDLKTNFKIKTFLIDV